MNPNSSQIACSKPVLLQIQTRFYIKLADVCNSSGKLIFIHILSEYIGPFVNLR